MTMLKIYLIRFKTPYHVGWRKPRKIIDHITVLRALLNISFTLGIRKVPEEIVNGAVKSSAILPTAKIDGKLRLLAPFPPMPSMIKLSKLGVKWITLESLKSLAKASTECLMKKGLPIVDSIVDNELTIKCIINSREDDVLKLKVLKKTDGGVSGIVDLNYGDVERDVEISPAIEYHNRIDRVTGASDIYVLRGWKTTTPFWLAFKLSDNVSSKMDLLLKVLMEIGIGGYRSRGWGLFEMLHETHVHEGDLEVLRTSSEWLANTYNILLGTMLFEGEISFKESYIIPYRVEGKSGPSYAEYDLEVMSVADVGSMVYVVKKPTHKIIEHNSGVHRAFTVFNPIVINGGVQT